MHWITQQEAEELFRELEALRSEMIELETTRIPHLDLHPDHLASAGNLLHYVALRRHDIRNLQDRLASLGLSSLGRTEAQVLRTIDAVLGLLAVLRGTPQTSNLAVNTVSEGRKLLDRNTEALLGARPRERRVRIMVTMPTEAASNYDLVRNLLANGMNCMRINCSHDGPPEWLQMVNHLRRAERETGRSCMIEMDLAGPKLRTGKVEPGAAVMKFRPKRDEFGRVQAPCRIWLTSLANPTQAPQSANAILRVSDHWLAKLRAGQEIRFRDARGTRRSFTVTEMAGHNRWAEASQTFYLTPGVVLNAITANGIRNRTRVQARAIPRKPKAIPLTIGERLVLTKSPIPGRPAVVDENEKTVAPSHVSVTLPELFDCVQIGQPIWFDDGKIGGVIAAAEQDRVTVEITQVHGKESKLAGEKGINLPESDLRIPALTQDDHEALEFVVRHADIVGYSFVRTPADVEALQARLAELGGEHLGVLLKIETQQAFANLPQLLLAAMKTRAVGVMIARGDLAVECGYQRLAELQEEILWISEAAHIPVVWATQVLESLVKIGSPSRSEITDAAMGERAECVMLNKGPYLVAGVKALDDILTRMEPHQEKKRSMLRKLKVATAFPA